MTEDGGEFGGGGLAFEGFGATAEGGSFGDEKLGGTDIAEELGLITNFHRFGSGNVAVDFAPKNHLGGVDFSFNDCLGSDGEGALGDDFAFKSAVKFERSVEGEGAFNLDLFGNEGGTGGGRGRLEASGRRGGTLGIAKGSIEGGGFVAVGSIKHSSIKAHKNSFCKESFFGEWCVDLDTAHREITTSSFP